MWKQMNLKKLDSKQEFYVLKAYPYTILHEAIRQKKWNIFIDTSIFILKELLFTADATKMTPFHSLVSLSDHLTISHIIKASSQGNVMTEEILKQTNAKGQNILHLLIDNKKLETEDLKQILCLLKNCFSIKPLLQMPDNFNWLPVSYYFMRKFKKGENFANWIKIHEEIVQILMPSIENFNYSGNFQKEDFFLYLCCYNIMDLSNKKNNSEFFQGFKTFAKNYTIFNNKFLEAAFHKQSEDMLIFMMKKIPEIQINTYINNYDYNLAKKTHTLELLFKNNWNSAINLFFNKKQEKFFVDYRETQVFKFLIADSPSFQKVWGEITGNLKENAYFSFGFSLIDEIIEGLKVVKEEGFYSKLADLIFKKTNEIFQNFNTTTRELMLMNIKLHFLHIKEKNFQFRDSITIADLFELDDNQMIELFE